MSIASRKHSITVATTRNAYVVNNEPYKLLGTAVVLNALNDIRQQLRIVDTEKCSWNKINDAVDFIYNDDEIGLFISENTLSIIRTEVNYMLMWGKYYERENRKNYFGHLI